MIRGRVLSLAVAALVAVASTSRAQETAKPETGKESSAERPGPRGVNLRVQLVISRYQGDRKLASFPYTLIVATTGVPSRMRMGVDTPEPVTGTAEGGKQT